MTLHFKEGQPAERPPRWRYAIKRALALLRHQRKLLLHGNCKVDPRGRAILSTMEPAAKANLEWFDHVIEELEGLLK